MMAATEQRFYQHPRYLPNEDSEDIIENGRSSIHIVIFGYDTAAGLYGIENRSASGVKGHDRFADKS